MKVQEKVAIAFIKWHFPSVANVFDGAPYETFRALVATGKDIAAAEEYFKLNHTTIAESHFAVVLAKELDLGDA